MSKQSSLKKKISVFSVLLGPAYGQLRDRENYLRNYNTMCSMLL